MLEAENFETCLTVFLVWQEILSNLLVKGDSHVLSQM